MNIPLRESTETNSRRSIETELRESEERFRQVAEAAGEFIWEVDAEGLYRYASPVVTKMLGYAPDELVGKRHFFEMFTPENRDTLKEITLTAMGRQETFTAFSNTCVRKDGTVVLLESSGMPVTDEAGTLLGYRGVNKDVTVTRQLEEQLRQAQKLEAVGQLAGGFAHDLNNILMVIFGYGEHLKTTMELNGLSQTEVDAILAAAERAAALTRSLLAFSRKQVMNRRPLELAQVISAFGRFLTRIIGEDIRFITSYTIEPLPVMADSGQIEQVILNLVTNARDAMPAGGDLTIETAKAGIDDAFVRQYGVGTTGDHAVIRVIDTGAGMDQATRNRVFEPFFTTKEVNKGTGLGLSVVYGIVAQHNGFITIDSEQGRGTTVSIHLPLMQHLTEESRIAQVATAPAGGTETILLAEDSAELRQLMALVLERIGYTVITAGTGEEALNRYRASGDKVDLFVADLVMPVMSGTAAAAEIRKLQPDLKVIFLSGYSQDLLRERGQHLEDAEILTKPISPLALAQKIRDLLDR